MHLLRVVADHRDPRPRRGEAAGNVRRLTERRGTDDEEHVVRPEPLAQSPALSRQHAGEQAVVLRESRAAAERLLEDRRHEALRKLDKRRPGVLVVRARTDDERRRRRLREEGHEGVDGLGRRRRAAQDGPVRSGGLALLVGRLLPVVHRHDHECRSALRLRRVECPLDGCGNVLGAAQAGRR